MEPRRRRSFVETLYNHNPFYLIGACCVLYAIKRVFRPMEVPYIDPWMLMAALSGLTIFLAFTAWVVVRFGKVWEDARSLVLVLVIMFLSMSVSFDEILNINGTGAFSLLAFGFVLSVVITESVVRLLDIPFPALFRLPYYLVLALFFGYPTLVSPEVTNLSVWLTRWRILAFPSVAGLCTLTLLPAVRRGAGLINDKSSACPWNWPLLPWALFGFLGLAVCGRSYYLSISFDSASGDVTEMFTAFGAYALNPFLFCVSLVVLEIAIVQRNRKLQNGVVIGSSVLMLLCSFPYFGSDPMYAAFLRQFVAVVGSPIFFTLFGLLLLGGVAWFRRIPAGEYVVLAALAGLSVVGWKTLSWQSMLTQDPSQMVVPLGVIVALLLITGLARKDAFRCFLGAAAISAAIALLLWRHELIFYRRILPAHVFLFSTVLIGLVFEGRTAAWLRLAGAGLVPFVAAITTRSLFTMGLWPPVPIMYFATMAVAAIVYALQTKEVIYLWAGGLMLGIGLAKLGWSAVGLLIEHVGVEVVASVGFGIGCFAMAAIITAHKAGAFRRNRRITMQ